MSNRSSEILKYWDRDDVESMYDKHLLNAEIELIKQRIPLNAKVLEAGCGEGEGTFIYSTIPGVVIHAVDFSEIRLKKAAKRLKGRKNVLLKRVDFLKKYSLDDNYDIIVSQRFLINLKRWRLQKKILFDFMKMLKVGGKLLILEGSKQGMASLNEFRSIWDLKPIPMKWHNWFIDDSMLEDFMQQHRHSLIEQKGLGTYFLLTRGIRPILDKKLNWDCNFNHIAATKIVEDLLGFDTKFSRLKFWVFQK